jgi:hypothetical protein
MFSLIFAISQAGAGTHAAVVEAGVLAGLAPPQAATATTKVRTSNSW